MPGERDRHSAQSPGLGTTGEALPPGACVDVSRVSVDVRVSRIERRCGVRRMPSEDEPLSRVRLRGGRELSVVDVSNGGLLVEGPARLLPGTHLDVHVITRDGRELVRSRVIRAYVSALKADLVCYRGALAFDRPIDAAATRSA